MTDEENIELRRRCQRMVLLYGEEIEPYSGGAFPKCYSIGSLRLLWNNGLMNITLLAYDGPPSDDKWMRSLELLRRTMVLDDLTDI